MEAGIQELLERAKAAQANAYAPYSKFPVGAAVRDDRGRIFAGCNVENASFGVTICAERNAIFHMVAAGGKRIGEILIVGETDQPLPPCGACRQVIAEFAGGDARVHMVNRAGEVTTATLDELLPFRFHLDDPSRP
ncbi:MAG TPA: cytidine deaminase [Candidatus Aminicenantes bacterium]|nr:cytidine deaminase [Candidatus Aminicenantes bacterium]